MLDFCFCYWRSGKVFGETGVVLVEIPTCLPALGLGVLGSLQLLGYPPALGMGVWEFMG